MVTSICQNAHIYVKKSIHFCQKGHLFMSKFTHNFCQKWHILMSVDAYRMSVDTYSMCPCFTCWCLSHISMSTVITSRCQMVHIHNYYWNTVWSQINHILVLIGYTYFLNLLTYSFYLVHILIWLYFLLLTYTLASR